MCHKWADCVNTIGGYKCVCRAGTTGGGAANKASAIAAEGHRPPENADDGPVGCRDVQVRFSFLGLVRVLTIAGIQHS